MINDPVPARYACWSSLFTLCKICSAVHRPFATVGLVLVLTFHQCGNDGYCWLAWFGRQYNTSGMLRTTCWWSCMLKWFVLLCLWTLRGPWIRSRKYWYVKNPKQYRSSSNCCWSTVWKGIVTSLRLGSFQPVSVFWWRLPVCSVCNRLQYAVDHRLLRAWHFSEYWMLVGEQWRAHNVVYGWSRRLAVRSAD